MKEIDIFYSVLIHRSFIYKKIIFGILKFNESKTSYTLTARARKDTKSKISGVVKIKGYQVYQANKIKL